MIYVTVKSGKTLQTKLQVALKYMGSNFMSLLIADFPVNA